MSLDPRRRTASQSTVIRPVTLDRLNTGSDVLHGINVHNGGSPFSNGTRTTRNGESRGPEGGLNGTSSVHLPSPEDHHGNDGLKARSIVPSVESPTFWPSPLTNDRASFSTHPHLFNPLLSSTPSVKKCFHCGGLSHQPFRKCSIPMSDGGRAAVRYLRMLREFREWQRNVVGTSLEESEKNDEAVLWRIRFFERELVDAGLGALVGPGLGGREVGVLTDVEELEVEGAEMEEMEVEAGGDVEIEIGEEEGCEGGDVEVCLEVAQGWDGADEDEDVPIEYFEADKARREPERDDNIEASGGENIQEEHFYGSEEKFEMMHPLEIPAGAGGEDDVDFDIGHREPDFESEEDDKEGNSRDPRADLGVEKDEFEDARQHTTPDLDAEEDELETIHRVAKPNFDVVEEDEFEEAREDLRSKPEVEDDLKRGDMFQFDVEANAEVRIWQEAISALADEDQFCRKRLGSRKEEEEIERGLLDEGEMMGEEDFEVMQATKIALAEEEEMERKLRERQEEFNADAAREQALQERVDFEDLRRTFNEAQTELSNLQRAREAEKRQRSFDGEEEMEGEEEEQRHVSRYRDEEDAEHDLDADADTPLIKRRKYVHSHISREHLHPYMQDLNPGEHITEFSSPHPRQHQLATSSRHCPIDDDIEEEPEEAAAPILDRSPASHLHQSRASRHEDVVLLHPRSASSKTREKVEVMAAEVVMTSEEIVKRWIRSLPDISEFEPV
ncbi:hypothetical protein HDU67_002533 [Dinochytrium kinnereticum]|nr:hypothetical protein HDU67_002533 [Dinochytrium kinnereticum]